MLIYQPRLVCRDEQKNIHSRPVLVLVLTVSTDGSCCALSLSSLIKAERSTSTCHVSLHSQSMLAWSPHSKHELYVGRVGPIVIFVSPLLVLHLASCSTPDDENCLITQVGPTPTKHRHLLRSDRQCRPHPPLVSRALVAHGCLFHYLPTNTILCPTINDKQASPSS